MHITLQREYQRLLFTFLYKDDLWFLYNRKLLSIKPLNKDVALKMVKGQHDVSPF